MLEKLAMEARMRRDYCNNPTHKSINVLVEDCALRKDIGSFSFGAVKCTGYNSVASFELNARGRWKADSNLVERSWKVFVLVN